MHPGSDGTFGFSQVFHCCVNLHDIVITILNLFTQVGYESRVFYLISDCLYFLENIEALWPQPPAEIPQPAASSECSCWKADLAPAAIWLAVC